ncbi:hypothetical protein ACQ9AQ_22350, partial [Escherichia coli]|uniref:hypothetical protein n=1 Tax=Escherichia coli TaxID=562 RepID=UPI003D369C99
MMSLWDALRMNMMISYQELVRTFPNWKKEKWKKIRGINILHVPEILEDINVIKILANDNP